MNRREFLKKGLEGIVVSIPLISSCSKNPVGSKQGSGVNIYFLNDEKLTIRDVMEKPLSNLEIHWKPWIVSDDILSYKWSSHLISLKKEMPLSIEDTSLFEKPFVVTANEERCYLGYLNPSFSSWIAFNYSYISLPQPFDKTIYISYAGEKAKDPRNDSGVKECLINKGQYQQ